MAQEEDIYQEVVSGKNKIRIYGDMDSGEENYDIILTNNERIQSQTHVHFLFFHPSMFGHVILDCMKIIYMSRLFTHVLVTEKLGEIDTTSRIIPIESVLTYDIKNN